MKKKYLFCTHTISIVLMVVIMIAGLGMTRMAEFETDPLYPILLAISEVCLIAYCIYVHFCFSLRVDEKGVTRHKAQDVIFIPWEKVTSVSVYEDRATRRMMLKIVPEAYVKSKKISFFRTQTTETIEVDVAMKYIDAIRQFYTGEVLGVHRLEEKLETRKAKKK